MANSTSVQEFSERYFTEVIQKRWKNLECPALFVPVEMRQTGTEGAVGWHVGRSIRQSRL
jgi:hypothetical protein